MDDPNITMEEYIQLMTDKARGRDQTYNWETVTYSKEYCDDLDSFTDFGTDFPAIVYNDAPTSNQIVSSEPTGKGFIKKRAKEKPKTNISKLGGKGAKSKCMRTRSKARRLRQQQQQQEVLPHLVETPKDTMADNRTMAELAPGSPRDTRTQLLFLIIEAA
ncbi:hypothetical protein Tco_1254182 [Tanacetum coccineum]